MLYKSLLKLNESCNNFQCFWSVSAVAKDAEETAESRVDTSAVAKVAEIAEPRVNAPIAKVVVSAAKKVEGVEKKSSCECFKSKLHYLKWLPECKGLAHCRRDCQRHQGGRRRCCAA